MDIHQNRMKIREYLDTLETDFMGIGELSRYEGEFLGLREDITNRYTSAVSFGFVLTKGVLDTVVDGPNSLYLHHYRQINYRLDMTAYLLSRKIEQEGCRALPFAASQLVDWRNQKAHISHKHIAVIAGVGWIGRNNLLVHPVHGSQVRLNTVLTDMPLEPDKPLGYSCGECRACAGVCPAGAIGENPSDFDHMACFEMLKEFKNKRNLGHYICGICVEACRGKR